MVYPATIARSMEELKVAVVSQKPVIVLKDDSSFWKIEGEIKKAIVAGKGSSIGGKSMAVGATGALGAIALLALNAPAGLAYLFAGGVITTVAGAGMKITGKISQKIFMRNYRQYVPLFDYNNRYVFFFKMAGEARIEDNDRPWIEIGGVYPQMPSSVELRLPNGMSAPNHIDGTVLKFEEKF